MIHFRSSLIKIHIFFRDGHPPSPTKQKTFPTPTTTIYRRFSPTIAVVDFRNMRPSDQQQAPERPEIHRSWPSKRLLQDQRLLAAAHIHGVPNTLTCADYETDGGGGSSSGGMGSST